MTRSSSPGPGPTLVVRRGRASELPRILDLLEQAASFARERGHPMWPKRFPTASVRTHLRSGELYVGTRAGQVVGMFLLFDEDRPAWGPPDRPARYLHRLAVDRAYAGEGIGRALLAWAVEASARSRAHVLRLDTVRANPRLRAYYRAFGFRDAGDRKVGHRWITRFELDLLSGRSPRSSARTRRAPVGDRTHGGRARSPSKRPR